MVRLDLRRVRDAVTMIDPVFLDTPQFECGPLGAELGCSVVLKVETLNPVRNNLMRAHHLAIAFDEDLAAGRASCT